MWYFYKYTCMFRFFMDLCVHWNACHQYYHFASLGIFMHQGYRKQRLTKSLHIFLYGQEIIRRFCFKMWSMKILDVIYSLWLSLLQKLHYGCRNVAKFDKNYFHLHHIRIDCPFHIFNICKVSLWFNTSLASMRLVCAWR